MEQFYLHICSETPTAFAVNSQQIGWVEKNYQSIDLLVDKQDFILSAFPINSSQNLVTNIAFSAKICWTGGKIISTNSNIIVTDYGKNHFKISVLPLTLPYQNPKFEKFYTTFEENLISINKNILNFSNSKNSLFYPLNYTIFDIKINRFDNLFSLSGKTKNNKTYALFINQNLQVEFEGIADKIEFDGTQIITLQEIQDIARHGLVTTYKRNENGFLKAEQYSVFTQNDAIAPASSFAIPWAFMEAINVKNFTLARTYLHPNLSKTLQDEHISAYFGEFLEVTQSLDANPFNLALVYKGNPRFVKIYQFKVNENRITDIDCLN